MSQNEDTNQKSPTETHDLGWGFPIDSIIKEEKPEAPPAEIHYDEKPAPPPDDIVGSFITLPKHEKVSAPINYTTLVVSGGSTKGNIALGCLQYAWDQAYLDHVKTYVGTSIGSAITYLMAIGYSPREVMVYLCVNHVGAEFKHYNLAKVVNGEGAFSFDIIGKHMEKLTLDRCGRFFTLKDIYDIFGKKLIFPTYNMTKGCKEYLSIDTYPELPALIGVKMSSILPLIFEKFKYMGSTYIDGGIAANFAVEVANKPGEKVLGINMLPKQVGLSHEEENDMLSYINHIMFTPVLELIKNQMEKKGENCDIIQIIHKEANPLDFDLETKEKLTLFSKGYRHAKKFFEEL